MLVNITKAIQICIFQCLFAKEISQTKKTCRQIANTIVQHPIVWKNILWTNFRHSTIKVPSAVWKLQRWLMTMDMREFDHWPNLTALHLHGGISSLNLTELLDVCPNLANLKELTLPDMFHFRLKQTRFHKVKKLTIGQSTVTMQYLTVLTCFPNLEYLKVNLQDPKAVQQLMTEPLLPKGLTHLVLGASMYQALEAKNVYLTNLVALRIRTSHYAGCVIDYALANGAIHIHSEFDPAAFLCFLTEECRQEVRKLFFHESHGDLTQLSAVFPNLNTIVIYHINKSRILKTVNFLRRYWNVTNHYANVECLVSFVNKQS